jgi:hypothetical protein
MPTIDTAQFVRSLTDLLEEVHVSAPNPRSTWMTSNEPDSGFLGTLSGITAEDASRAPAPGMNTIAAHAEHLRYSLSLANRAFRGENAYATADWAGSWRTQTVDAEAWERLREGLRGEHTRLLEAIRTRPEWTDPMIFQGSLALIGHAAYHLGAIRQLRRLLTGAAGAS